MTENGFDASTVQFGLEMGYAMAARTTLSSVGTTVAIALNSTSTQTAGSQLYLSLEMGIAIAARTTLPSVGMTVAIALLMGFLIAASTVHLGLEMGFAMACTTLPSVGTTVAIALSLAFLIVTLKLQL